MSVVLVCGVQTIETEEEFSRKTTELKDLALALDLKVDYEMYQKRDSVARTTYFGQGKVEELKNFIKEFDVTHVIFNDELSSNQYNTLSDLLEVELYDRTSLILAIFEKRAHTREAILQVQIAKLRYQLPRLRGMHQDIIGQLGGSGFRGAGETQLELDRRVLYGRLNHLEEELSQLKKQRQTQREKRKGKGVPVVALVGYTNAGKSTLMNHFMRMMHKEDKQVFEKDMLFATLQTSTRLVSRQGKFPFLLSDTVGFINYLPHVLVEAFKSTLEEITEADLLLHIVDASNPDYAIQVATTKLVLEEIGAGEIETLYVYNKVDLGGYAFVQAEDPHVFVSAKNNINIDKIEEYIRHTLYPHALRIQLLIPYEVGEIFGKLNQEAEIFFVDYREDGIYVDLEILEEHYGKYSAYRLAN